MSQQAADEKERYELWSAWLEHARVVHAGMRALLGRQVAEVPTLLPPPSCPVPPALLREAIAVFSLLKSDLAQAEDRLEVLRERTSQQSRWEQAAPSQVLAEL